MNIIQRQFVAFILYTVIAISVQKDLSLHYPPIRRECGEESDEIGFLAQLISLLIFVFYILIICGLIKACLGLCCTSYIGSLGLYLLMDRPSIECQYSRNTEFCLNVVFFLVLPLALIRKLCVPRRYRMAAGECEGKKSQKKKNAPITTVPKPEKNKVTTQPPKSAKKKKGHTNIYRDGNDSETQDTKYVLEQLHRSEQSLRSGIYTANMVSK